MIFASDLIDVFLDNPFIKEAMDIRNLQNIEMKPRIVDDALTYYGKIAELGLEIYSYEEFFLNDDGEEEGIIPSGSCIMAHSKGEGSDVKMIRLTSRPLPRPDNVEGWCVIYPNGMGA